MTTTQGLVTDWVAEGARPAGQPGTVGRNHGAGASWTYPAIETLDGRVLYWCDTTETAGTWIVAPRGLAASFDGAEEWRAACDHAHGVAWQTCDSEDACASLAREQERTWGR